MDGRKWKKWTCDEAESEGTRNDILSVGGFMIQLNHSSLGHPSSTNPTTQENPHTVPQLAGCPRANALV